MAQVSITPVRVPAVRAPDFSGIQNLAKAITGRAARSRDEEIKAQTAQGLNNFVLGMQNDDDEMINSSINQVGKNDITAATKMITALAPRTKERVRILRGKKADEKFQAFRGGDKKALDELATQFPDRFKQVKDLLEFEDKQGADAERAKGVKAASFMKEIMGNPTNKGQLNTINGRLAVIDSDDSLSPEQKQQAKDSLIRLGQFPFESRQIEMRSFIRGIRAFDTVTNAVFAPEKPQSKLAIERKLELANIPAQSELGQEIIKQNLTSPGTQVTIQNIERGFKVPTNFMLKDEKNPSLGVVPIPGGPADKPGAETIGDLAMLEVAKKAFPGVRELVFEKDKKGNLDKKNLNRFNLFNAFAEIPGTKGQELAVRMEFGIQGITRVETGAAMPAGEITNTRKRFEPRPTDSAKVANIKLDMYEAFINGTINLFNPSGDASSQFKSLPEINEDKFNAEFNRRLNRADPKISLGKQAPRQRRATDQPPTQSPILRFDAQGNRL